MEVRHQNSNYLNYWNSIYSTKNFFGIGETKLAQYAYEIIKKREVKRILEIGCGQGRDAIFFSKLGYQIDAIDISQNAVNFVNKTKDELGLKIFNVVIHDVLTPFEHSPETFDFIYSNLALQFFNLAELQIIFDNIIKVMKNDSLFYFSTKKKGDKYYQKGQKFDNDCYSFQGIPRYFYDEDQLKKIMKKFHIIEFDFDKHQNLDDSVSVWWKILLRKK